MDHSKPGADPKQFGPYLRNLREMRGLAARGVERLLTEIFPDQKHYQISQVHLNQIENGVRPPPNPMKIKGLSRVYGEKYEFMLYRAGYLDDNPFKPRKENDLKLLRERYFVALVHHLKRRPLTEEEQGALEDAVKKILIAMSPEMK